MNVSKQLLRKYINGACTPEEENIVVAWLAGNTDTMQPLGELLEESWQEAGEEANPDIAAPRVRRALQQELYPNYKPAANWRSVLWRSAAAVIILLLVSLLVLYRQTTPNPPAPAANTLPVITRISNRQLLNHTYTLPDRSLATLAPGSSLTYENDAAGKRLISLQGEGFFDVQKDTAHPFTVQAGSLYVTALGTSFRVSDRVQPGHIVVQLYTGKVKLTQQEEQAFKPLILKPGQQFTFHPARHDGVLAAIPVPNQRRPINKPVPTPQQPGPADDGSWTFTSRPLQEVISMLQVRYHTPIHYDPADLSGKYFTGTLSATDSLPFILSSVAALNGLRVTITDSVITINKNQ